MDDDENKSKNEGELQTLTLGLISLGGSKRQGYNTHTEASLAAWTKHGVKWFSGRSGNPCCYWPGDGNLRGVHVDLPNADR